MPNGDELMNEYAGSRADHAASRFNSGRTVSLNSILSTEELYRRPARPCDYAKENCPLFDLTEALADSPCTILQTLAEKILEVFHADSAGISLLTTDDNGKR